MDSVRGAVELQIISKIIQDRSLNIIDKYNLEDKYFEYIIEDDDKTPLCKTKEIINFIKTHYKTYHNVPDKSTVKAHFPYLELVEISESEDYLVKTLKQEYGDVGLLDLMNKANDIHRLKGKKAAADFLAEHIDEYRDVPVGDIGIDLISQIDKRVDRYEQALQNPQHAFVSTGFPELDKIIGGFNRSEELVVIQGRSGQSKTFLLLKLLIEAFKTGERVAFFEPEMSDDIIGYRLDPLLDDSHTLSNFGLVRANQLSVDYKKFAEEIKNKYKNCFKFICPEDFQNLCTVSKLKTFCKENNITILGIDGIEVPDIIDERATKTTDPWTQLTNISKDLLAMSRELNIPIISTVQAKRMGREEELGIDTISGAYGISRKCTMMITMNKIDKSVTLKIEKNRNGIDKQELHFTVDLDKGCWKFDGSEKANSAPTQQEKRERTANKTLKMNSDAKVDPSPQDQTPDIDGPIQFFNGIG